ncbi:MAG: RNA degradosome polyphosphate kinase, partial [Desulfosarcina sp.]
MEIKEQFFNRELSWLGFARRVLSLVEDDNQPILERVKFAGIVGMLHDEFFMKRISGLKRQMASKPDKVSIDGCTPQQEFEACREEIIQQLRILETVIIEKIRPTLADAGLAIHDYADLEPPQKTNIRNYFCKLVHPILTPLAVDAEHPFPFVSNF